MTQDPDEKRNQEGKDSEVERTEKEWYLVILVKKGFHL